MSNRNAWLDLISYAEGTRRDGGRGYNVYYGGGTFDNTQGHPGRVLQPTQNSIPSSAAGAYQFMPDTWKGLGGGAMTPQRQDQYAYQLGLGRGVDFDTAPINAENVALLAPEWASLPTLEGKSYYGQPVKSLEELSQFANTGRVQEKTQQVTQEQVPTLIKIMEGILSPYRTPTPASDQSSSNIDADPELISAALAPDPELTTQAPNNDTKIKELQRTQEAILKLLKQKKGYSEEVATRNALQQSISDAYDAFTAGKSVI